MSRKLFRAVVVLGAAVTAPACDAGKRPLPAPRPTPSDARTPSDAAALDAPGDAPSYAMVAIDAPPPADAGVGAPKKPPVEVPRVLIL